MHLGLTDGPFVPHNLISTEYSAVPLLKIQMATQTSNINDFLVQERNPGIHFFSRKNHGKRTPSRFPNRAPIERERPVYRAFFIPLKNLVLRLTLRLLMTYIYIYIYVWSAYS